MGLQDRDYMRERPLYGSSSHSYTSESYGSRSNYVSSAGYAPYRRTFRSRAAGFFGELGSDLRHSLPGIGILTGLCLAFAYLQPFGDAALVRVSPGVVFAVSLVLIVVAGCFLEESEFMLVRLLGYLSALVAAGFAIALGFHLSGAGPIGELIESHALHPGTAIPVLEGITRSLSFGGLLVWIVASGVTYVVAGDNESKVVQIASLPPCLVGIAYLVGKILFML